MMEELYHPEDNEFLGEKYYKIEKGICGPSVLAVLTKNRIQHILDKYLPYYKGHLTVKGLKGVILDFNLSFKQKKGQKAKIFPVPQNNYVICRIQWTGPDINNKDNKYHGWTCWIDASCNTHYVLIKKMDGKLFCFCNNEGWFEANEKNTEIYLGDRGYVTSYLEIGND